jgi:hypothetical protein
MFPERALRCRPIVRGKIIWDVLMNRLRSCEVLHHCDEMVRKVMLLGSAVAPRRLTQNPMIKPLCISFLRDRFMPHNEVCYSGFLF